MRQYVVQPGDSPASIAARGDMAGCPKCAIDLISVNPHKATVRYPNGYVTFRDLSVGERLWLPDKWIDGTLDRLSPDYFASLPSADGMLADPRPNQPPRGCAKDYVVDTDPQSPTYNQCVYAPVPLKPDPAPSPPLLVGPVKNLYPTPKPPIFVPVSPVSPTKPPPGGGSPPVGGGGAPPVGGGGGGGGGSPPVGGGNTTSTGSTTNDTSMSTGAKVAIALGIAAAGGGIAWALTR